MREVAGSPLVEAQRLEALDRAKDAELQLEYNRKDLLPVLKSSRLIRRRSKFLGKRAVEYLWVSLFFLGYPYMYLSAHFYGNLWFGFYQYVK